MGEQRSAVLAQALGIRREDVERWVIDDYPDAADQGLVSGHIVEIADGAPATLFDQLGGNVYGCLR